LAPAVGAVAQRDGVRVLVLGAAAGVAAAFIAELELAWIGFLLAALTVTTLLVAARDATRVVGALFVLSLQADAAYRLFYGRAGSEGMAFPLCILVGIAWVGLRWLSAPRRALPVRWAGPFAWPIGLVAATAVLSWLFSPERFVGAAALLFQLQLYFVFWVAIQLVQTEKDLEWVMRLLLVSLATQCVVYYVQSATGLQITLEGDRIEQEVIPRPGGTVCTNPAGFASFVIPLMMLATARWITTSRRPERILLAVLISMGVLAVGLTYTRVAWAGMAGAFAYLAVTAWSRRLVSAYSLAWVGAAVVLVLVILAPTMGARHEVSPLHESYDERRGLNEIALNVISAHPITGVGPGSYAIVYKRYLPESLDDQWLYKVHNEYLLRAAETGVMGGVAWVLLLIVGFRQARRVSRIDSDVVRTLGLGWSAGLLAVAWQMYWVPWDGFQFNALLWFLLGLTVAGARVAESGPEALKQ
jgi:O-antigen ligase